MLNPLLAYTVEFSLQPTPAQATALLQLSAATRAAELLARDQAVLALAGQDVALAALAGGPDHPDRSLAGEAAALAATPPFRGCPPNMLVYAASRYGSRLRQCAVHDVKELPAISALRVAGGDDLVQPAGSAAFEIDGVGEVAVDLTHSPQWACEVLWGDPYLTDQWDLAYSGSAYIEHQWVDGQWRWTVELDFVETW